MRGHRSKKGPQCVLVPSYKECREMGGVPRHMLDMEERRRFDTAKAAAMGIGVPR